MLSNTPLILLSLASLGLANPVTPKGRSYELMSRQNDWNQFCNYWNLDDNDPSIAADLWVHSGAGYWFDRWLTEHHDLTLWTAAMDEEIIQFEPLTPSLYTVVLTYNRNGESGFACSSLTSACNPPDDCSMYI